MRKALITSVAALCTLFAAEAMADDSVAVMKLDVSGEAVEPQAAMVLNALLSEVNKSDYTLDANGNDITYSEMQMLTGCDTDSKIACYDSAVDTLGAQQIIFGDVADNGDTHLIWYVSGKGIFREVKGVVSDKESADKLAQRMLVGEMGTLIVTSNVPDADVFVDGKRVGKSAELVESAEPISLIAGPYIVSVRKEGYEKESDQKVMIVGGETSRVNIDLVAAFDTEGLKQALKISGWASLGVGVAALAVGGAFEALMQKEHDDMEDAIYNQHNGKEAKKHRDAGDIDWTIKTAMYGTGAVLTAAGVALVCVGYLYDFDNDDSMANSYIPKVDVAVSPEYSGMNFGWTF